LRMTHPKNYGRDPAISFRSDIAGQPSVYMPD
jgi:hypothetical protein